MIYKRNKKVIGATKTTNLQGVKFDSKLEQYFYDKLKLLNIDFVFQYELEIQPKFKYNNESIRNIKLIVDFYIPSKNMLIDTKGFQLADNKLKWKLAKHYLKSQNLNPFIYLPKNQKECNDLLIKINAN